MAKRQRKVQSWDCWICSCLKDGQTFPSLLNASKKQLENSFATASVIIRAFANADTARLGQTQDLDAIYVKGFIHSSTHILQGSLKRVLPKNCITDAGEIMQTASLHGFRQNAKTMKTSR